MEEGLSRLQGRKEEAEEVGEAEEGASCLRDSNAPIPSTTRISRH